MKPHLLSEHNHQIILDKIQGRKNINYEEYVEDVQKGVIGDGKSVLTNLWEP